MPEQNYKGVTWNRELQKWKSNVRKDGVDYNCGVYDSQILAVKARDLCILKNGLNIPLQYLKPVKK